MESVQWPELHLDDWSPTQATLHRMTQIVGKTRLSLAPFENHWWHCALYVTVRGLGTSPMPYADGNVSVEFDFSKHLVVARTDRRAMRCVRLENKSVADFYREYCAMLHALGVDVRMHAAPNEMAVATPFADDTAHATYDPDAVHRWWRALCNVDRALKAFRSGFVGKCSPSHFWWGGFDLACTRFSGRPAPRHAGGIPNCPDYVMREAYSHECISAGFWPGSAGSSVPDAAFYAYAYPEPTGCTVARIAPSSAYYDTAMGEWILPYEAVRTASDPFAAVGEFLESTYDTAAKLGDWDVAGLRSARGARAVPLHA